MANSAPTPRAKCVPVHARISGVLPALDTPGIHMWTQGEAGIAWWSDPDAVGINHRGAKVNAGRCRSGGKEREKEAVSRKKTEMGSCTNLCRRPVNFVYGRIFGWKGYEEGIRQVNLAHTGRFYNKCKRRTKNL